VTEAEADKLNVVLNLSGLFKRAGIAPHAVSAVRVAIDALHSRHGSPVRLTLCKSLNEGCADSAPILVPELPQRHGPGDRSPRLPRSADRRSRARVVAWPGGGDMRRFDNTRPVEHRDFSSHGAAPIIPARDQVPGSLPHVQQVLRGRPESFRIEATGAEWGALPKADLRSARLMRTTSLLNALVISDH
jgi:hypothetical protein